MQSGYWSSACMLVRYLYVLAIYIMYPAILLPVNHAPYHSQEMAILQLLLLKPPPKIPSEADKTCVPAQCQMTCLLLKLLLSVSGPPLPVRERGQCLRSHHLGVGVAGAPSSVSLTVDAQTQSPQLAHSHIWA